MQYNYIFCTISFCPIPWTVVMRIDFRLLKNQPSKLRSDFVIVAIESISAKRIFIDIWHKVWEDKELYSNVMVINHILNMGTR